MDDPSPSSSSSPQSPPLPHHNHHQPLLMAPPSSPPPHHPSPQSQPPSSSAPPSSSTKPSSTRRIPPPCWSHEETVALIDSYRDKWYALRRGNLRAAHWQEVADGVAARCPHSVPSKTSVQCRHKMEKLRKRYRTDLQRAGSIPNHRFSSSWVHFKNMDAMERGPNAAPSPYGSAGGVNGVRANAIGVDNVGDEEDDEDEEEEDDDDGDGEDDGGNRYRNGGGYMGHGSGYDSNNRAFRNNNREFSSSGGFVGGSESSNGGSDGGGNGNGFKIRNPRMFGGMMNSGSGVLRSSNTNNHKTYGKFAEKEKQPNFASDSRYAANRNGSGLKPKTTIPSSGGDGAATELAEAVKVLGDRFLKMEKMKMDMVQELERKKMEMELKRTEMILESQQRLVEAFVNGVVAEKRKSSSRKRKAEEDHDDRGMSSSPDCCFNPKQLNNR